MLSVLFVRTFWRPPWGREIIKEVEPEMSRREEQGGKQEDNQNMMSMEMLIQLQKEFEMLKKSNEEDVSLKHE